MCDCAGDKAEEQSTQDHSRGSENKDCAIESLKETVRPLKGQEHIAPHRGRRTFVDQDRCDLVLIGAKSQLSRSGWGAEIFPANPSPQFTFLTRRKGGSNYDVAYRKNNLTA